MNQRTGLLGIKKVDTESVFVRGFQQRTVTKVFFKDGTVFTFSGGLSRREALFNAYYQKGRDSGMTVEEAALYAGEGSQGRRATVKEEGERGDADVQAH